MTKRVSFLLFLSKRAGRNSEDRERGEERKREKKERERKREWVKT